MSEELHQQFSEFMGYPIDVIRQAIVWMEEHDYQSMAEDQAKRFFQVRQLQAELKQVKQERDDLETQLVSLKYWKSGKCDKCSRQAVKQWEYCTCCGRGGDPLKAIEDAKTANQKLEAAREALEFYGEADTYEQVDILGLCPLSEDYDDDGLGKTARKALEEIGASNDF